MVISCGSRRFQGDSGGPVAVRESDGTFYLVGITSYVAYHNVNRTCAAGYPDVETRVTSYLTWINSYISQSTITYYQHRRSGIFYATAPADISCAAPKPLTSLAYLVTFRQGLKTK